MAMVQKEENFEIRKGDLEVSGSSIEDLDSCGESCDEQFPLNDYIEGPKYVEGDLSYKGGRSAGVLRKWKTGLVTLNLCDGGSIRCLPPGAVEPPGSGSTKEKARRRRRRRRRQSALTIQTIGESNHQKPDLEIMSSVRYIVKDIKNDEFRFLVEIREEGAPNVSEEIPEARLEEEISESSLLKIDPGGISKQTDQTELDEDLQKALAKSQRDGKPLRIYFRCNLVSEKTLWISAFQRLGRLQDELRHKKGWNALTSFTMKTRRKRDNVSQELIEDCRILMDEAGEDAYHSWQKRSSAHSLDRSLDRSLDSNLVSYSEMLSTNTNDKDAPSTNTDDKDVISIGSDDKDVLSTNPEKKEDSSWWKRTNKSKDTEYLVQPHHAYPNRWMTNLELHNEMLKPSSVFHDLRRPDTTAKVIGILKVEVLQCLGLPKLDFASGSDPVIYFVCGSYAFATDIIWNRHNPVWLCKTRRACIFPLFDGFARLYVGVFDDDGKSENDDFAGRVVLDLARCRPRSTYDVTIPLRQSAQVYATRKRGAIRLRFSIEWHSERDALLSYIPKQLPTPSPRRRNDDLTVLCADEKAFRNITITVHGCHLPGSFSVKQMRAVMLEINFTRKRIFIMVERLVFDTIYWRTPRFSVMVFGAWMHSTYAGRFSLAPAYIFLFLSMLLMNNYFHFVANDSLQNGFIPPSWEELLMALLSNANAIEPLDMKPKRYANEESVDVRVEVSTHRPRGLWMYRILSGSTDDDTIQTTKDMDFPFSQGLGYTKVDVAHSLATARGGVASMVRTKQHRHKLGYHGREDGDFSPGHGEGNAADEVDDDAELCSDFSRVFADSVGINLASGVHKVGSAAGNGIALIGSAAGAGAKAIGKNSKRVGKRVTSAAGSGINTIGKNKKKVGHGVASVAGTGFHIIGSAATKVGTIVDTGIDKSGIKKVRKTLGKVVTEVGSAAETGIDKVGLKKVGKAVGNAAGAGFNTIGSVAQTGIKGVGKTTKKAGKAVAETAGKAVISTKKAGHSVTKKASNAVESVGDATGASIAKIGKKTKQVGKALKFAMTSTESCGSVDPEARVSLREFYPEQNVEFKIRKTSTKTSLADELEDFKNHMHRCTLHIFNDRTHIVRNPEACYFNEAKKSEARKSSNVHQDLDRLLETGAYSNSLIAIVGVYLEPMVAAALSFLSMFRSLHNIFTWQDPMLSFWVSISCFAATAILFMFPWRLFCFVTGLVLTGPQNFILRKVHEMGRLPRFLKRFVREPHCLEGKKLQPCKVEHDVKEIPRDQPIICAPQGDNFPFRQLGFEDVDPREIHEVSVPYSRLMYQRFYDWPPESQYARVVRNDLGHHDSKISSSSHDMSTLSSLHMKT
jgi:hypothetical protein